MNKMEQLFQEQRRNLLFSMVYAKGLPPNINKETMKQPLKEQNNAVYKPKRNQETTKNRNVDKKKQKSSHDVQDVSF